MTRRLDYSDHLARDSERFGDVLAAADLTLPVPTCPDWTAGDLFWHLTEVQWQWGTIVRQRLAAPPDESAKPARPVDLDALGQLYSTVSLELSDALADARDDEPAWTWSDDHTVGFIRRRQAHEALIHRLDAELVTGTRTPLDPELSADGVDEALRVMFGGCPPWGTITPQAGRTLRIEATDTGDRWLVTLARFTGTDPEGTTYDEPDISIAADDDGSGTALATIRGTAEDLDCWLWRRPPAGEVQRSGDEEILAAMDAIVAQGIN